MTWTAASLALLALALAAGFAWFERTRPPARVVALLATLAALAVVGRIVFAPIPNVKPTTDIVLIAGYALGGAPGFLVGAVTAVASNLFYGHGPHTPWQMAGWGGVGVLGALLARVTAGHAGRWTLTLACGAAGYLYGTLMNTSLWVLYSGDHTLAQWTALMATGLPFDLAHVLGNVVFCLIFGPALVAALRRFRTRFEVDWRPAAPVAATAALAAVLVLPPAAEAGARVPAQSVRYLERAQNADGGFGAAPGQASTPLHSGWAALGLAAAGRNPADVRRNGRSVIAYTRAAVRRLSDVGDVQRTLLVLGASGLGPRALGRDLERDLLRRRRRNGSFAGRVNSTAFGILALRAIGRSRSDAAVRGGGRWLALQANRDGGFNFAGRGGASGIDDTAAALQALVAAGRRRTPTARRAARFLVRHQNRDGGFPLAPGGASNAQSTAFAVQALVAARRNPVRVRRDGSRSPLGYLRTLVAADGSVRYSRTSRQTPVWVTAQALLAFARTPFPLPAAPRSRRARPAAAAPRPERPAEPAARPRAERRGTAARILAKRRGTVARPSRRRTGAPRVRRPGAAGRDTDPSAARTARPAAASAPDPRRLEALAAGAGVVLALTLAPVL